MCELLDLGNRNFFRINTEADSVQPEPIRIRRPGQQRDEVPVEEVKPRMSSPEEIQAFLAFGRSQ